MQFGAPLHIVREREGEGEGRVDSVGRANPLGSLHTVLLIVFFFPLSMNIPRLYHVNGSFVCNV